MTISIKFHYCSELQVLWEENFDFNSIVTPIDYLVLEQLLVEAEYDREKTNYLISGFKHGFSIEYNGPQHRRDFSRNHRLRAGNKTLLWNKLIKEVSKGRCCGPMKLEEIPYDSIVQSPITLIPKASGKDARLIFDLSHDFDRNKSINHYVDPGRKTVKYQDLNHALRLIMEEEDGKNQLFFGKYDALSAFRNIPLGKGESKWLIMKAEHPETGEEYYFADRVLSFGHCLSCRIYQDFALAVGHIYQHRTGKRINSYLDDVLIIRVIRDRCWELMMEYCRLCELIGLPLAEEKTEGPTPIIVFLGMLINALDRTIGLPQDKVNRALGELTRLLASKKVTVHYLQKLTGLLNFFCRAIYPGMAFTRRMYNKFHKGGLRQYHHIRVDRELRKDCEMWKTFLTDQNGSYNRPFMDFTVELQAQELQYFTDSSFLACAGYFDGRYFWKPWPTNLISETEANIVLLELYSIAVSIVLWAKYLRNYRVVIYSDSQSAVDIVNSASSRCPRCMHLVRIITKTSMNNNTRFFMRHISGKKNVLADKLSRLQIEQFKELVPVGKLIEPAEDMPEELWPIPDNWWCD